MRHSTAKYSGSGVRGRKRAAVGGLLKRMVDVVFATWVLVLLAPVFVVTGVLIRALLGTPVIVVERSVGLGGESFGLLSFRTGTGGATSVNEWAEALTTVLRKSGIGKLPHLINVVRGDMSLVGPELVGAQQALHYGLEGPELLLARPGVVSVRRYARHILRPSTAEIGPERLYILRWSLWLDLRILCGALARIHATDANRPAK